MGEWVVLELNSRGEQEDPDRVREAIAVSLKNAEIFVPAAITQVGEDRVIHYLMDGYAFVRLDRQPVDYFRLEGTKYVQTVLVKPGLGSKHRRVSTVGDHEIMRMREQIRQLVSQGIGIGDVVRITSGPYRNMRATVIEEIPEQGMVQVHIRLRSKQDLKMLPRSFLVVVERAPLSSISTRLNALRDWIRCAGPVLDWNGSLDPLHDALRNYERAEEWNQRGYKLFSVVTYQTTIPPALERLKAKTAEYGRLLDWEKRGRTLFSFIASQHPAGYLNEQNLLSLQAKYEELAKVEKLLERIRDLWDEVQSLSKAAARRREGKTMVQNVLVDGHNLAFRCLYAPGMGNLRDRHGRPTGVILGFLKSLAMLRKKFPEASLHVVWDGSSRRRKARFGDYKANRHTESGSSSIIPEAPSGIRFDPIRVLRDILPLLGTCQFWNPDEEADDIIATLVRGELSKQNNVIFSTDRDFLQLVSANTSFLYPAVGSRNEILFDPGIVLKTLGVAPGKVVQLRALYGDSSDNIPGVPRVPKKILRSLIQAHGSVDGLYRSGLAGVTKGQYERLRSAEPQVRINVELMTLVDVGVTTTPPDVDPDNVAEKLRELDINPDSLLQVFFGSGRRS